MTVDKPHTPVVAGPALPLADHAAILPELAEWARGQMADSPLDEDQLAAIFAHSQHLRSLARAHPDLIAAVPQGRGGAEVTAAIAACEQAADQLTDESGMMAALRRPGPAARCAWRLPTWRTWRMSRRRWPGSATPPRRRSEAP